MHLSTPAQKMQPSPIAQHVARLLHPFIREQASKDGVDFKDPIKSEYRRCYHLSIFNIIKLEGLTCVPGNMQIRDKIKICALPLKDLPSSKLEELLMIISLFQSTSFDYVESMYSFDLWTPIIKSLFANNTIFQVNAEYSLSGIESEYPDFRTNMVVRLKKGLIGPLLFVELSRDHLLCEFDSHKDEDKIAISMAVSLLKIIGQFSTEGIEFLEKLAVYGILGAATDFDVVSIYPVFTNPENVKEFYFVFNSSKKYLRFNILGRPLLPENIVICSGNQVVFHEPHDNEPIQATTPNEPELISINSNSAASTSTLNKIIYNEVFCEFIFFSFIN